MHKIMIGDQSVKRRSKIHKIAREPRGQRAIQCALASPSGRLGRRKGEFKVRVRDLKVRGKVRV